jgi:hypothetical protein
MLRRRFDVERDMIRERVNGGIARARAQGKHSGRPRLKPEPTFLRLVGIPRPRGQGKVPVALPPPAYVVVWPVRALGRND